MKRSSAALLLAVLAPASLAAAPLFAQAKRPAARKPTAGSTAKSAPTAATAASKFGCEPLPTLSATIPATSGCPAALYSLRYLDTTPGTGAEVTARKWLTVNYTGYLQDGTKFDTSVGKDPITFPYGAHQVIAGWDTGFEGMKIGGKRRLFIPYELAYGEAGRPPIIPAKSLLVFDVELLGISDTPPAPKAPPTPPTPPTPPAGTSPSPAGATPAKPPASPANDPNKPAPDGAKPAPPSPTTDPTKPTTVPPKP